MKPKYLILYLHDSSDDDVYESACALERDTLDQIHQDAGRFKENLSSPFVKGLSKVTWDGRSPDIVFDRASDLSDALEGVMDDECMKETFPDMIEVGETRYEKKIFLTDAEPEEDKRFIPKPEYELRMNITMGFGEVSMSMDGEEVNIEISFRPKHGGNEVLWTEFTLTDLQNFLDKWDSLLKEDEG